MDFLTRMLYVDCECHLAAYRYFFLEDTAAQCGTEATGCHNHCVGRLPQHCHHRIASSYLKGSCVTAWFKESSRRIGGAGGAAASPIRPTVVWSIPCFKVPPNDAGAPVAYIRIGLPADKRDHQEDDS
jgi:hypothetical protein